MPHLPDKVRGEGPAGPPSPGGPTRKRLAAQVYLAVWRWHFWAGLLVSPVLIALAVTGTLIVFQPQLEPLLDRDLYFIEDGSGPQVPLQAFAEAVPRELPGFYLAHFYAYPDPARTWDGFAYRRTDHGITSRRVFFDWRQGELLGHQDYNTTFFRQVIEIHRTLLAGLPGRVVTESATCWGIVSVLSGLYLWWPRKKEKLFGVWLPRLRGAPRTILRDWHTVPALYLSLVLLVIMVTGLFFSPLWGAGFRAGAFLTGGFPAFLLSPPASKPAEDPEQPPISLDEVLALAGQHYPFTRETYEIVLPTPGSQEAFQVLNANNLPWKPIAILFIDAYTGERLHYATGSDLPWQTHLARLFYPIHTGAVLGWPTQILALLACLVLMATTLLGVVMWWRRRPKGRFGSPRQPPPGTTPAWIIALTAALALFLPTVGLALAALFLFGLARNRLTRRTPAGLPPD